MGECFFWYELTQQLSRIVPEDCETVAVVVVDVGCLCCGQENGKAQLYVIQLSKEGSITTSSAVDLWSDADCIAVTSFCWCEQVSAASSHSLKNLFLIYFLALSCLLRWMSGIKLQDRVPSEGLDDIISLLRQNRLRWYVHVLRKEDNDWMKKCMEYEMEGSRPRGRPKKTWREIVEKDCQAHKLNREDAMDHNRWRKQIRDD